jgi:glycine/D-amino acid oxidase-like deaminating enzyme
VPSAAPALSTQGPFVWHVGAQEVYLRPRADGSWLTSPCDERPGAPGDQAFDADALPMLQARVARFAPAWVESCAAPPERWSCQRTFAADRRMRIARDATRPYLVWAAALGGHGATAACAVGERAAALALAALA